MFKYYIWYIVVSILNTIKNVQGKKIRKHLNYQEDSAEKNVGNLKDLL